MIPSGAALPPGAERREHPRTSANDPVKVVLASRHVVDGTIADRSLRGLRLRVEDVAALSTEVTLLAPAYGAAYIARVVWRTPPYAGLSISRTVEMRNATGPESAALHKLWREHIIG